MNNISKIINKIYSNMLRIILNDIESDYHEVASKKYMETLMNRYSNIAVDSDSMEELV